MYAKKVIAICLIIIGIICVCFVLNKKENSSSLSELSQEPAGIVEILERPELPEEMMSNNYIIFFDGCLLHLTQKEYSFLISGEAKQIQARHPEWNWSKVFEYKFGTYTIVDHSIVDDPLKPIS